jgi:hypothetical protein
VTIIPSPTPTPTALNLNLGFVPSRGAGTVCTFRESQNGVYADGATLVVTNPSANLGATSSGADLNTARRSPALVYNGPTSAARYLYAIGGDNGSQSSPLASVELAKADGVHGGTGAFTQLPIATAKASQQGKLTAARTYAGAVSVGRFIYLVGGFDGTSSLKTVERAEVLDPAEAPQIDDADLVPDPTDGLATGLYFYRVSAVLDGTDANNPSGETLAGDEFAIFVPKITNKKVQVVIAWAPGSATPSTKSRWRIYRTTTPNAAPQSENLVYETPDATALTILDKGTSAVYKTATLTSSTGTPLPFGAIGNWQGSPTVHQLKTARAGAAVTIAPDPPGGLNAGVSYIYVGYGYDSTSATTFPATYEYLPVKPTASGVTEGVNAVMDWTPGVIASGTGRWLLGGYAATPDVDQIVGSNEFIFFTNGSTSFATVANNSGDFDRGTVGVDGLLAVTAAVKSYANAKAVGYGAVTAVNYLFQLGGLDNNTILDKMTSVLISDSSGTLPSSITPQGGGQIQNSAGAKTGVFLPGATVGGAYFWMAGGAVGATSTATKDTFWVLY